MKLSVYHLITLIFCVALTHTQVRSAQRQETRKDKLVWSDEFDNNGLPDSTKWSYDVGDGCPNLCGWGNNELQYYTEKRSENARVEQGNLIIEARREKKGKQKYTSARLVSKHKGDWLYGRIEARIKLPTGRGTWAAFWMLPTDWKYGGWPKSGEIDIMEHVGFMPDSIFGTIHTDAFNGMNGKQKSKSIYTNDAGQAFHVYAAEWTPDYIEFSMDGKPYHRFNNQHKSVDEWPFDQKFHVIFNLAVGGNWGGSKGVDEKIWPQKMVVDYVRVYRMD
ncbi:MAG: glycoside hydrolase family 16 protein [Bacteroidota bacterium]